MQRIILIVRGWKVSAAVGWEKKRVSAGRVLPERAAYRSTPVTKARLSMQAPRGVSASVFVSSVAFASSSSEGPRFQAPRRVIGALLMRLMGSRRFERGRTVLQRLGRGEAALSTGHRTILGNTGSKSALH